MAKPKSTKQRKGKESDVINVESVMEVDSEMHSETNDVVKNKQESKKKNISPVSMLFVKQWNARLSARGLTPVKTDVLRMMGEELLYTMVDMLKDGNNVVFPCMMSFKLVHRDERTHVNPRTKEEIHKDAHNVLYMKVMPHLKKELASLPLVKKEKDKGEKTKVIES